MQSFQDPNGVEVGIGRDGFMAAYEAITNGDPITYNGASGRIVFDAYGERLNQSKVAWAPNEDGDAWERGTVYP
jgi:hypothetical protein